MDTTTKPLDQTSKDTRLAQRNRSLVESSKTDLTATLRIPRRDWMRWGAAWAATWVAGPFAIAASGPLIEVWKDPNCGCCRDWIQHLQDNGFRVQSFDTGNSAIRQRLGMPTRLGSCHTARVDGYVIEGHVPATDIQRLLRERPSALGLAVPGMPVGSPGMDGPAYGGRRDPFDVLLVRRDGSTRTYASYHQAQPTADAASADGDWAEGEVRRVDLVTGKITLRHGVIPDLDMPPMTMVFSVRNPAQLRGLQVGARVRFRATQLQGQYIVTDIKSLP
jgi:hypothetical protein